MNQNCKQCRVFARVNRLGLCVTCHTVDEKLISLAWEILDEHGQMTVFDLAEHLGIYPDQIFRWIDEGRMRSSAFKHKCPFCGQDMIQGNCKCHQYTYTHSAEPPPNSVKHPEKFHSTWRVTRRIEQYWEDESRIRRKQKRSIWLRT